MMRRKRAPSSGGGSILGDIREQYFSPKKSNVKAEDAAMGNFEPQYPESMSSFAEGLRTDIMDLLGSGANVLNKSISIIFPFVGQESYEQFEDSIHEIVPNGQQPKRPKDVERVKLADDALRMRCPSTWNEKRKSSSQGSRAQKGGKVLLDKLSKNTSIQAFVCGNMGDITTDHLLIVGNLRMILARKNHDANNSASILWSQPFREIGSCAINCALSSRKEGEADCCKLDVTNRRGEVRTVPLQDAKECVQVMMIIQTKCAGPSSSSTPSAPSSVPLAASNLMAESECQQGGGMSPLAIGSSPVSSSCRLAAGKGRRTGKNVISTHSKNRSNLAVDKENEGNEGDWAMEQEGVAADESPKKKARVGGGAHSSRRALGELSRQEAASPIRTGPLVEPMEEASCEKNIESKSPFKNGGGAVDARQNMLMEAMAKAGKKSPVKSIDAKISESAAVPLVPAAEAVSDHLRKYKVMLKSGVPQPAVLQKMVLEGVSEAERNLVLGIKPAESASDKPHLKKYLVMIKSGIPRAAIKQKMAMENVSATDQALVFPPSPTKPAKKSQEQPAASDGPQMVGFHWEPLKDEHESSIKNSIWDQIHSSSEAASGLHQSECSSLSSLFAKKSAAAAAASAEEDKGKLQRQLSRKGSLPKAIDMSRSTNVSIGLSAFRQRKLSVEQVVEAVSAMDVSTLSPEDLMRLSEMLPTENEIRALAAVSEEDMHASEKWLRALGNVPTVSRKVQSMIFMSNFAASTASVLSNITTVSSCIEKILSSAGLKEILRCVLHIGNTMNKGTWKGGAKGFRLVSLARLSHTKSTDGKSTIMNYLVQLLHTRQEASGDKGALAALQLDDELASIHNAKNVSMADVKREVVHLRRQLTDMAAEVSADFPTGDNKSYLLQFIREADAAVTHLEVSLQTVTSLCENFRNFFGEDKDSPVGQMMDLMSEFVTGFSKAKNALKRSIQIENRKRQRK